MSLLDADVVIVTTAKPTDVEAVRNDPLLNNLPAAKRGALLLVDDFAESGWTLALAARLLRAQGAGQVLPLVLAVQG